MISHLCNNAVLIPYSGQFFRDFISREKDQPFKSTQTLPELNTAQAEIIQPVSEPNTIQVEASQPAPEPNATQVEIIQPVPEPDICQHPSEPDTIQVEASQLAPEPNTTQVEVILPVPEPDVDQQLWEQIPEKGHRREIAKLLWQGKSPSAIAKCIGRTPQTVRNIICMSRKEYGVKFFPTPEFLQERKSV